MSAPSAKQFASHQADERRAMQLVAGLIAIAGVSATGIVVVLGSMALADRLTDLGILDNLVRLLRGAA